MKDRRKRNRNRYTTHEATGMTAGTDPENGETYRCFQCYACRPKVRKTDSYRICCKRYKKSQNR